MSDKAPTSTEKKPSKSFWVDPLFSEEEWERMTKNAKPGPPLVVRYPVVKEEKE